MGAGAGGKGVGEGGQGSAARWRRGPRLARRLLLRGAAAAAGMLAAAGVAPVVEAAGRAGGAAPAASSGAVTVSVALDVYALQNDGSPQERNALYRQILQEFEAQTPGVRVQLAQFLPTTSNMAAIVAGTAPDVFPDCCVYGNYVEAQLLLDLEPYLRRDNVDLSIWSPSQVRNFATPTGTYALSRNVDSYAVAVRLDAFDEAGLEYPSVDWTYEEFAHLAAVLTRHSGSGGTATVSRYGAGYQDGFWDFPQIVKGFGGHATNAARTQQSLSSPACLQAARWLVEDMFWAGIATPRTSWAGTSAPNLSNGQLVLQEFQINQLLPSFTAWRDSFKWTFYPPPVYPQGRANPVSDDFYAVSATTRHPDQAWELIKWLSAGETFQRFMMKTFLFSPALNRLWPEWQAIVEATVPGLRGKGLQWFAEAAQQGWGTPQFWLAYGSTEALQVDTGWWAKLLARSTGVTEALRQMDQQVNALVATAARQPQLSLAQRVAAYRKAGRRLQAMFAAGPVSGNGG